MRWCTAVLLGLAVTGCRSHAPGARHAVPHYVVGPAWESADGAWFYPQERLGGSMTGLSDVLRADRGGSAADGEDFDPGLPEAAVQTLQLPAIIRVIDLENGRSILVRAVDRGPASPARVIGLDWRSRLMLGIAGDQPARVRLEIDASLSEQAAADAEGGPRPTASAAPQTAVEEEPLAALQAGASVRSDREPQAHASPAAPDVNAILRSQVVGTEAVQPSSLWIDAGQFGNKDAAQAVADAIGGEVVSIGAGPRALLAVDRGPFQTSSDADAASNRARAGGITGARIVVR